VADVDELGPNAKALSLLERFWGRDVADAVFNRKPITYTAGNGVTYRIWSRYGYDWMASPKVRNLTTGEDYCVQVEGYYNLPYADQVFSLLEYLRTAPEVVETRANHIGALGVPRPDRQAALALMRAVSQHVTVKRTFKGMKERDLESFLPADLVRMAANLEREIAQISGQTTNRGAA